MNQLFRNGEHELRVLGSSSSGNGYIFDDYLIIEAGLPFSKYKQYMNDARMLWISHVHGDHCSIETIKQMIEYKKDRGSELLIYGNAEVIEHLKKNDISAAYINGILTKDNHGRLIHFDYMLKHSVQNSALRIFDTESARTLLMFATDTNVIPPKCNEPLFLVLESNYFKGTYEAFKLAAKQLGEYHNDHTLHHLSADEADKYIVECADEQTVIIEAHQSGLNRTHNNNLQITLDQVKQRIEKNKGRDYV